MKTSSAGRREISKKHGFPVGWVFGGLGIVLILASIYLEYGGPTVWRGSLQAEMKSGQQKSWTTPELVLESGKYDLDLDFRQPFELVDLGMIRYRVRVTSEAAPGWEASGSLSKEKRKKGRSHSNRSIYGNVVASLPAPITGALRFEISGKVDADTDIRLVIRRLSFDYRFVLWLGIILLGLSIGLDSGFRSTLLDLFNRLPISFNR